MKRIGLLAGSLRAESYARKVVRNLGLLVPNTVLVEPISIDHLPLLSDRLSEQEQAACRDFKDQIQRMDGFCLVTPEINRGIPGCLKNALDMASVSDTGSLWAQKPVVIVSVSTGELGGLSASQQLKQLALVLGMQPVQPTELYLSCVQELFDEHALLTDETVLPLLRSAMMNLSAAAEQITTDKMEALTFKIGADKLCLMEDNQSVAQATFEWSTGLLVIQSITVDPAQQHQGFASQLMLKLIMMARLFHLRIVAGCSYSQWFFKEHPAIQKALCL
ncbi:NAD(P)H-dependent oxidoreductase [Levilactobacillus cerevisiae]|uniref:NAD(P)H-dependent oxidoreductase n=1 Tax=Levilactobacillus cerevisiae TaxID=1704076 RepID=UPI0013DE5D34|nr:NAD(P)H-dependent oxidoreductase [Levilactobacillus cerevisiae]